jgi:hypothetical protein
MTPSLNYKKTNWELNEHLTDENYQTIPENLSVNRKVKMWNKAILGAAKESIPKGRRKDNKPFWSYRLDSKQQEVSNAREAMEEHPSDSNVCAHNKARAEYTNESYRTLGIHGMKRLLQ